MRLSGKWLMAIAGLLWTVAGVNVVKVPEHKPPQIITLR